MVLMNLFSVFDPISYFGLMLNWVIVVIIGLFFPYKYYLVYSKFHKLKVDVFLMVKNMFNEMSFPNGLVVVYLCVMTFIYLVISNLLSLFPFVFTSTAHPFFTLGLGLVMWLSFFLMGWLKNLKESAAHLVPEGSPLFLSFFMVLIESVSHLIRPFTLSIRLAANMMAGHLILGLLASLSVLGVYGGVMSLMFQSLLLMLEFAVSIIQGFVFSILLMLYVLEYY